MRGSYRMKNSFQTFNVVYIIKPHTIFKEEDTYIHAGQWTGIEILIVVHLDETEQSHGLTPKISKISRRITIQTYSFKKHQ